MRIKQIIFIISAVFVLGIAFAFFVFNKNSHTELDPVEVNDIVYTLSKDWDNFAQNKELPDFQYDLDYNVVDENGKLLAGTRKDLSEDINSAIRNRDTIVDIEKDGNSVGKIYFYNDTATIWNQYKTSLLIIYICILAALAVICLGYVIFLNKTVFKPFIKMKKFATNVAAGKLDVPLEMDKNNLFGAFTESFDIMREELHKARENERKANQSKKELVASLSHDIKTPLASIKAVCELMLVTVKNEKDSEKLETISKKSEQIETLVNNMFQATLEELQELNVTVSEVTSAEIPYLIQSSDYENRVQSYSILDCIVLADPLRLQQVLDNIISNSYKYAGTPIGVNSSFQDNYLVLEIKDSGKGVPQDELPLLLNKYYRGENAKGKSGYGLGLYISNHLVERMQGKLQCENRPDGYVIRLMLRIAD